MFKVFIQGNEWLAFFHNIKNKTDLIKMAANFFKTEDGKKQLSVPHIFTEKEETWRITKDEEQGHSLNVITKRQTLN